MTERNLYYYCLWLFCCIGVLGYNVDINFPIIYEDPSYIASGRSSYFGYSVLLSKTWIQIGAPRANFSTGELNIKEPGLAYHCKFNQSCVPLRLGKSNLGSKFPISSNSWFGVTMDYEPGTNGNIVVCGHRWKINSIDVPGACYSFHPDQDLKNISNILTPTSSNVKGERFFLKKNKKGDMEIMGYKYSLSQSGFSIHFSQIDKASKTLLLGAPGVMNWKGSVVKCEKPTLCTKQRTVFDTYNNPHINEFDLFGYQVSSGHFFSKDEVLYVTGSPRSLEMKGYVLIYKLVKRNSKLEVILKVHGKTIGEYFGSSLAVADITNDGLDDLVVGAPFFSQNGDEGRVYVLEFYKDKIRKMEIIEGKKERGRFGTAIAAIGDLDQDGFADIAVGAPYEGNGVIYIYYGRSSGLNGPYQRIPAENIYKNLQGFGISFSGQVGPDNHYFNGIAVGSFRSGHAVILRTRPVVTVNTTIYPVTPQLSVSNPTVKVGVCVFFTGNVLKLSVTQRILADRSYGRAKPPSQKKILLLQAGEQSCENYTFNVNHTEKLIHQSMEFLSSAHVTNTTKNTRQQLLVQKNGSRSGYDDFSDQDPIQRISSGTSEGRLMIPYSQKCKVCQPDLQLKCFILEDGKEFNLAQPFIIGSMKKYQLQINVTNSGDPSYVTNAEVKFSKEIHLASLPYECIEINEIVNCELGIITDNNEGVTLDLDMSSVGELNIIDDQTLYINVSVSTAAKEENKTNNFRDFILKLCVEVDAYLYGKSQKDNYPVSKYDNGSFASVLDIVQIYEVHKKGVSPLKILELTVQVPVNVTKGKEEMQVLSLHKPDGIIDNKDWYCSVDSAADCIDCQSTLKSAFEVIESPISENVRTKRSVLEDTITDEKAPPSNRTFYINCTSENVKCTTVRCQLSELEAYGKITLRLKVNVAVLGPLMGQKDIVYVTSKGKVVVLNPDITRVKNVQQEGPHNATASSTIIGKIPKKKVDLWIIVASVIGGILLAMVVAMGLAKAGFFQRQTKADLQELKEKARHSQIQPQPISPDVDFTTNMELQ